MDAPRDTGETGADSYELKLCSPDDLTPEDLERCFVLITDGGAVDPGTMKRDLPRSQIVAIARYRNEVVAVGVIKPVRKQYAAGIAVKSGYSFPPETPELGYVVVDRARRKKGLSHEVTSILLTKHTGRLFATTDDAGMKKTLAAAGFRQEGNEWPGERGMLLLLGEEGNVERKRRRKANQWQY